MSASSVPRAPTTPSSVGTIDHLPMMVSLRSPRCRGRRWSASSGGLRVPFSGSSRQPLSARGASSRTRILVSDSNPESRQAVSLGSIFLVFLVNTQRNQSAKTEGKLKKKICDNGCALGEFFGERDVDRRTAACSSCCSPRSVVVLLPRQHTPARDPQRASVELGSSRRAAPRRSRVRAVAGHQSPIHVDGGNRVGRGGASRVRPSAPPRPFAIQTRCGHPRPTLSPSSL